MWAFPQQIVPLSFRLHKELAEEFNGESEWGYRGLKTLCIEGNISSSHLRNLRNGTVKPNPDVNLPEDLDWISPELIDGWTHLGDGEATAQVHPYKFTLFILKKVLETGAVDLITGKVVEVTSDKDGKANGVAYTTTQGRGRSLNQTFLQNTQQQLFSQKESSAPSSLSTPDSTNSSSSSKKHLTKSSLHHPDNPTFKSDASMLPSSKNPATTSSSSNPSFPNDPAEQFRNIHSNTSYPASSTGLAPSISELSEDSTNLSTDDDESILDGSISEESSSGLEVDESEIPEVVKNDSLDPVARIEQLSLADCDDNQFTNTNINTSITDYTISNISQQTQHLTDPASDNTNSKETSSTEKTVHHLSGDQIVLTLGPWTSKLLPSCPISGLRAHSITIQPSKQVSPFALFTEMRTSRSSYVSPEIYPRRDEVYVCGEGDTAADVPETSDDVEVVRDRCDELFKHVGAVSPNLKNGRILKRQACYLPVVDVPSHSGPFIGPTNVDNLYLASGHSCWGINNAPATGLLMSEILLDGEATSASVDGLEPEFYFDASPQQ